MLRISVVRTRAASKRSRVLLGAIGILVGLLMIAPSVSATEARENPAPALTPRDGIVRAPLGGTVHVWQCAGGPWVTIDHQDGWRIGYYRWSVQDTKPVNGKVSGRPSPAC